MAALPSTAATEVLQDLIAATVPVGELEAPSTSGIYAFFLAPGAELAGVSQPGDGPLYLGISSNLSQRDIDTHVRSGQSGFSTLRRSLGALLIDELTLKPRPRGKGASPSNFRNYRFDEGGEEALSEWMHRHLRVSVYPTSDPALLERELIALACPPLNLTGWTNPDGPAIKAARRRCAELAGAGGRRGDAGR